MGNKRILFVEAPYSYASSGEQVVGRYYPLGLGYLASYIRQFGYSIKIFQPSSDESYNKELRELITSFTPFLVGISVMTPSYPGAVEICNIVKSLNKNIVTVLGGHHVSAVGKEVLEQSPNTDFSVIGEGEITLHELIQSLESPTPKYENISGLAWRDNKGNIYINDCRKLIKDIDILPFPARDLVDMDKLRLHSYIDFGKKSTTMITTRGCPYKCAFCSSWLTMGTRYRVRSVKNIMQEINELVNDGIDHIVFEDDTMALKRERIMAICDELIRMPKRPTWYCLTRVDTIDYELAKKFRAAGCRMVNFGIESGSPEILKLIGKKISLDKAVEAVKACKKAGLRTQCTFIVGFPIDSEKTITMTYSIAKKINPTIAIFFPLTPYPGTRVFNEFLDESLIPKSVEDWQNFLITDNKSGISLNSNYTGEEIKAIANKFNRKFYLRPTHWLNMLCTVGSFTDLMRLSRGAVYLSANYVKELMTRNNSKSTLA
ncbi:MAG: radical SAM protein [Calditrichia bacterium]